MYKKIKYKIQAFCLAIFTVVLCGFNMERSKQAADLFNFKLESRRKKILEDINRANKRKNKPRRSWINTTK